LTLELCSFVNRPSLYRLRFPASGLRSIVGFSFPTYLESFINTSYGKCRVCTKHTKCGIYTRETENTELHDNNETTAFIDITLNNADPIHNAEYAVNRANSRIHKNDSNMIQFFGRVREQVDIGILDKYFRSWFRVLQIF